MATKWDVTAAVLGSNMAPPMRLIMLVLLDAADADDAAIPERFTPSLTDIVSRTGLGRGTVADRLNDLEHGGWVKRDRPTVSEARAGAKTQYALMVGDPEAGTKSKPKSTSLSSPGAGLVREEDQNGSPSSPGAGPALVREPDQASPRAGRGVVREPDGKDTPQLPTTSPQYQPARQAAYRMDEPALPIAVEKPKPKKSAKPKRNRFAYGTPEFDEFWEAYPRKDDRKPAWKAWEKALNEGANPEDIIAGAKRYRDDPNRNPGFTKQAKTWLNNDCWLNGLLPTGAGQSGYQPYQDPDPADYYGDL